MIQRRTPESAAMVANTQRAMAITPVLNRLTYADGDEIRAVFSDLIGRPVDDSFMLIPPFYTAHGSDIRIGRNVFINQNCTIYDLGGVDIGDDVLIGPNVSIITTGHPLEPSRRRDGGANRGRAQCLDRRRRDDHRRRHGGGEFGGRGGRGRHQGCSAEQPGCRCPGQGYPLARGVDFSTPVSNQSWADRQSIGARPGKKG